MRKSIVPHCALIAFFLAPTTSYFTAASAEPPKGSKAKALSNGEEKNWLEAVKRRQTADGATIWQVLQYAEKMRSRKFKIGSADVGYDASVANRMASE